MKKISRIGLDMILAPNLCNMIFFEKIFPKIKIDTDTDGNIKDHVLDNLKTLFKIAIKFAVKENSDVVPKLKHTLSSILDYGTEESSQDIRTFLKSNESKTPSILMPGKIGEMGENVVHLFYKTTEANFEEETSYWDFLNLYMNHVEQDFSRI